MGNCATSRSPRSPSLPTTGLSKAQSQPESPTQMILDFIDRTKYLVQSYEMLIESFQVLQEQIFLIVMKQPIRSELHTVETDRVHRIEHASDVETFKSNFNIRGLATQIQHATLNAKELKSLSKVDTQHKYNLSCLVVLKAASLKALEKNDAIDNELWNQHNCMSFQAAESILEKRGVAQSKCIELISNVELLQYNHDPYGIMKAVQWKISQPVMIQSIIKDLSASEEIHKLK